MLRFKVLVSIVPLTVAAVLARVELLPGPRPCIAVGDQSIQIDSMPWHADLHIASTDNPTNAGVRVQVADSAEDNVCDMKAATQFIAISGHASVTPPVIDLSFREPADYGVLVKSMTFTARDAPALIIGLRQGYPHLAAAL